MAFFFNIMVIVVRTVLFSGRNLPHILLFLGSSLCMIHSAWDKRVGVVQRLLLVYNQVQLLVVYTLRRALVSWGGSSNLLARLP